MCVFFLIGNDFSVQFRTDVRDPSCLFGSLTMKDSNYRVQLARQQRSPRKTSLLMPRHRQSARSLQTHFFLNFTVFGYFTFCYFEGCSHLWNKISFTPIFNLLIKENLISTDAEKLPETDGLIGVKIHFSRLKSQYRKPVGTDPHILTYSCG